jgi:ABC-type lipoprotein release transport system permease subunit
VGSVGVLFAARAIRHMFYGVSTFDPLTVAGTAVLLVVVALAASFWPARRAASVDPMQAMRTD